MFLYNVCNIIKVIKGKLDQENERGKGWENSITNNKGFLESQMETHYYRSFLKTYIYVGV